MNVKSTVLNVFLKEEIYVLHPKALWRKERRTKFIGHYKKSVSLGDFPTDCIRKFVGNFSCGFFCQKESDDKTFIGNNFQRISKCPSNLLRDLYFACKLLVNFLAKITLKINFFVKI